MSDKNLEFETRTGKIILDYSRCDPVVNKTSNPSCGFACIKADRLYGRNVLKIEDGKPILAVPQKEAQRLCNECLGCEFDCTVYGKDCIQIILPLFGLEEYRKKTQTGGK